jgi:hypothetical protein
MGSVAVFALLGLAVRQVARASRRITLPATAEGVA